MSECEVWNFPVSVRSIAIWHNWVAVGLWNGTIEILEINSGNRIHKWKGHNDVVRSLIFTWDGNLVSGSWDGFVKKWRLTMNNEADSPKVVEIWSRHLTLNQIFCVSELINNSKEYIAPQKTYVLVSGGNNAFQILDSATGNDITICRGHTSWIRTVVSLGDHTGLLASGSDDTTIRVWNLHGTQVLRTEVEINTYSLSLSPCGGFVAAGCESGFIKLYKLPTNPSEKWIEVWSVKSHGNLVWSISWSPSFIGNQESFLVSGSSNGAINIISVDTGAILRTLKGHVDDVFTVFFSNDGTKILTSSRDGTVRVWHIFYKMEKRIQSLFIALEIADDNYLMREVYKKIIQRTKRLWELKE